jgi:diaminohydroxyphosphoribosylaminopyrimidine deaminase / 5-amino-6-(5-phosphoribosylamino)uracil reductase
MSDFDTKIMMSRALQLARLGIGRVSPNPAVGCVIVNGTEVVGEGYHVYADRDHAEIVALKQAGEKARGATMYVTLEPCSHQGRTPPCTLTVIKAGIKRVVAAMEDPNPLVAGKGFAALQAAGVSVTVAKEYQKDAEKLNEAFLFFMRHRRPLVTLKCAVTLDGKIAAPEDNSGWITSETARLHVQQIRHQHDAIVTGIGTVLGDDPLLNDRSGLVRSRPFLRIVLDSQLRIPLTSRLVETAKNDVLVVCSSAASAERRQQLEARGVRVEPMDDGKGRTNPRALVDWLAKNTYESLMIEAGSKINWAVLDADIVDKVYFYYAPKILGGMESLPLAGGAGRRSRGDAIRLHSVQLHAITADEFAVEAYVRKES